MVRLAGKDKFLANIKKMPNGCWEWQRSRHRNYGQCSYCDDPSQIAPRWAYKLYKGEIPEGLLVRHTCDNPPCVNPKHLILGTHKDNFQDALNRGRHKGWGYAHAIQAELRKDPEYVLWLASKIQEGHARSVREKVCCWCGEGYFGVTRGKFCSVECAAKFTEFRKKGSLPWAVRGVERICVWCSLPFVGSSKFCSEECKVGLFNYMRPIKNLSRYAARNTQ